MRLYARWLATAVPCRQRAAQSSLWSHNRGVTAATVGRGRSRGCRLSHAYQRGPPSYLGWRKDTYSIVFRVHLAPNASICLLARDGHTMPSMSSTVAVVETHQRGDRCHGGPRSVKGESPFACISEGEPPSRLGWRKDTSSIVFIVRFVPIASIRYARWLATAVPCRQRAAQSPLWSHNARATPATVGRSHSRRRRPSHLHQYRLYSTLGPYNLDMLAGSRRPYLAVSEQHSRRCVVKMAGQPPPRWAAVAQGGVALRMHIMRRSNPLALFGAKTLTVSSL